MLGALLALLPFEEQLGLLEWPGGLSITGLEIIWGICLAVSGQRD